MELWAIKVIILFLIFILTLFFGLVPIKFVAVLYRRNSGGERGSVLEAQARAQKVLSYLNCFSGGVFLGTCLLHLFPEVNDRYDRVVQKENWTFGFPIDHLVIAAGFFLILLTENLVMTIHSRNQRKVSDLLSDTSERTPCLEPTGPVASGYGTSTQHHCASEGPIASRVVEGPAMVSNTYMTSYSSQHECDNLAPHHHHPGQTHEQTTQIHNIRSLLLLLALSLHTAFEGLAVGLEEPEASVWSLFLAVAVHKSIIAFTMGLQFVDTFQQTKRVALYMLLFSAVCPVGIAVGIAISSVDTESLAYDATNMVLQGLATGTFLYVTFFEVLQRELGVEEHSVTKVMLIIVGFVVIALANLLEDLHL